MVTAKKSGAEVIPFIKTYVNLPVGEHMLLYFRLVQSTFCLRWYCDIVLVVHHICNDPGYYI
jgi:hypothetical protein